MEILMSDYQTVLNIIYSAQKEIAYCAPNISYEVAQALVERKKETGLSVTVFLEFTEKSYRGGFGDIAAFEELVNNGILVFNNQGYNIFCLIADEVGYFYFPHSRFHQEEGSSLDLFPMEPKQVKKIKLLFGMLDDESPEWDSLVDEIGIETIENVRYAFDVVGEKEQKTIVDSIKNDPPLKPEFSRSLEVYRAKFQFIELTFNGGNIIVKRIHLPPNALPFKDDIFKKNIEANLRLFDNLKEKEFLQPFLEVKKEVDQLREENTVYLKSRKKSLIVRNKKSAFEEKLKGIREKIVALKGGLINDLQNEIAKTRIAIQENLRNFLLANPPSELDELKDETLTIEIENICHQIMSKIRFPLAKHLLLDLDLKCQYYDITWEDLHNDTILEEMKQKELINEEDKTYISELAISAKPDI